MTQANETNSRIARLETLMLEIAASNLRHDRTIDHHEQRITEHEEWQRRHEAAIARHEQWQAEHETAMQRHEQTMQRIEAQQEINQQAIAQLTASITDLRNIVASHVQRSELE